jgi:hypothetical protein
MRPNFDFTVLTNRNAYINITATCCQDSPNRRNRLPESVISHNFILTPQNHVYFWSDSISLKSWKRLRLLQRS